MHPDPKQTIAFLKAFSKGPYLLAAIPVEGGSLISEYFETTEGVVEWCQSMNPNHGLYYHIGTPRKNIKYRAKKKDIGELRYFWADVDPRKGEPLFAERVRIYDILKNHDPQPSMLINSGGGYQALWKLRKPFKLKMKEDIANAERYMRYFVGSIGADPQSPEVARILRLPGTVNFPSKAKQKAGREPARASYEALGGTYDLESFHQAPPVVELSIDNTIELRVDGRKKTYTEDTLPDGFGMKWESLIVACEDSFFFDESGYPSRSDVMIAFVRYALEKGYSHQIIYDILLSPDLKISEHVYAQHNVDRYAKRQISEASKRMAGSPELNERTAEDAEFIYSKEKKHKDGSVSDPQIIPTSPHNVKLALLKSGRTFRYNEFSDDVLVDDIIFEKHHATEALHDLERRFKTTFPMRLIDDTMQMLCHQNTFNPVVDYLRKLPKWDGVCRIDKWLIKYCGAEDNALNRAYGRLSLLAAVKRAVEPGCKFDEMLILEGSQGDGKSEMLEKGLCPRTRWYTDSVVMHRTRQEFMESVAGHWIIEYAELADMNKAGTNKLKALLSTSVDKARMAYARARVDWPRRFTLFGTTNQSDYLKDETGNRRFWPVACRGNLNAKVRELAQMRDKLWAEALYAVDDGEKIRLDPALYGLSGLRAKERLEENPYEQKISDAVGGRDGLLRTDYVVAHLGLKLDWYNQRAVGSALRRLGFKRAFKIVDNITMRVWARGEEQEWIELVFDEEKEIL